MQNVKIVANRNYKIAIVNCANEKLNNEGGGITGILSANFDLDAFFVNARNDAINNGYKQNKDGIFEDWTTGFGEHKTIKNLYMISVYAKRNLNF